MTACGSWADCGYACCWQSSRSRCCCGWSIAFALAFGARRDLTRIQSTYLPGPASYDGRASSEWTEGEIRKHVSTWPGARLIRGWSVAEEKKTIFCVENVRFTMWGDWLLHLGFLVIIVGLFVSAQWGWREDDIALAAGETYELDYASGYTLDFEPAPDADEPGRSTLSLAHGGVEGKAFAVSALKPHIAAPLSLFQVSTGPALTLSATEVTGESLWLQPLTKGSNASSRVTLKFAEGQEESYLFVPDAGVTLRIVRYQALPEEGFEQPVYLLRGYRGTQSSPLFSEYVTEDTTFEWQTLTFSAAVTDYLVLNAVSDWGWWIVVAGSLLLLIGAAMNRGPSPWVVCFQTERLEAEPLVFEQVTLWSRKRCGGPQFGVCAGRVR